jgi:hypothetical protein
MFLLRNIKAHVVKSVHVTVMCVIKVLVCRFNWRDIFTYIVSDVHSIVVSAIDHLLIRIKWSQWLINIWSHNIPGICVLKVSVRCRYVINNIQMGCCIASSVVWKVLCIIGHLNATISWYRTQNFWSVYCNFTFLKPISRSTVLLRISLIITNKYANC